MVMLADTDAGSVVTAAQSGGAWGYRLLLVQLALVPVLIVVMELSARLAITTGKGFTELIREHFGGAWAAVALATLVVTVMGALVGRDRPRLLTPWSLRGRGPRSPRPSLSARPP